MPFDSASMDLEKAMGRVAETGSTAFTLQCVTGGLERHHAKRLVQFLRTHKDTLTELSLFRTDVGTHAEAAALLVRFLRTAPAALHTLRFRSVACSAPQTRQLLQALAEHGHVQEFTYDGAALPPAADALVALCTKNVQLRRLDLSCEMWALGTTAPLAAALDVHRAVSHVSLNGCQLQDADAAPLLQVLAAPSYTALTHLELRLNQLRGASLPRLAAALDPAKPLQHLDLASNVALFASGGGGGAGEDNHNINNNNNHGEPDTTTTTTTASLQLVDAFCTALAHNTCLTGLYLRNTGVTADALTRIAAACAVNTTLRVLDLRQLAALPAEGFPRLVFDHMRQWKGVETLELDHAFTTTEAAAFVAALQDNTSLLSGNLVLPDDNTKAAVQAMFRRNRWWKRARELTADHHPAIYHSDGGIWMQALSRFGTEPTGATASFYALRERLCLWLESAADEE